MGAGASSGITPEGVDKESLEKEIIATDAGELKAYLDKQDKEAREKLLEALEEDEEMKRIFDELDIDKSGKIGKAELKAALLKVKPEATDELVEKLIKHYDTDGDGELSLKELQAPAVKLNAAGMPMTELEIQMEQLLNGTANLAEGAKDAKKSAVKTRRRSRDLEAQLDGMSEGQKGLHQLIRSRRNSKDFNEEEIRRIFDEIDTDKGGKLDKAELLAAFQKAEPTATEKQVEEMIKYADKDGDGQVDFKEFYDALTTKAES